MRAVLIGLLLVSTPAVADRGTVVTIGGQVDGRAMGSTFAAAGQQDVTTVGGARLTLSFEDEPLALPPPGLLDHDFRLAPELFAGFVADSQRAEGLVGAGLRGELHLAMNQRYPSRLAMYVAARGLIIGKQRDAATEFALGEYILLSHGRRFGWEGGAMIRPRPHDIAAHSHELDALVTIYVGWR